MAGQQQGPRKPATKFSHLRKKMQQNKLHSEHRSSSKAGSSRGKGPGRPNAHQK